MLNYIDPTSESLIDKVKTITTGNSNLKTISNLYSLLRLNLKNNKLIFAPQELISLLPKLQVMLFFKKRILSIIILYLFYNIYIVNY